MSPAAAWRILADAVLGAPPDAQGNGLQALHFVAASLDLAPEAAAALRLVQARRSADAAQLEFRDLLNPQPKP